MDIDPPDVVGVLSGVCAADVMFARKQPPVVQVQIELIEEPSETTTGLFAGKLYDINIMYQAQTQHDQM